MKTRNAIVALALLLASCKTRNENSALPIVSVIPPTATFTAGTTPGSSGTVSCKFDPASTEFSYLPYNPAENRGSIAAVVQNNLLPTTGLNLLLRLDTTTFLPHEAVVSFEYASGSAGAAPGANTIPVSGLEVAAGTKATIGVAVFDGTPISVPNGTFIRVTLSIKGKLLDGSIVHTSEREYLFRYCNTAGCGLGGPWAVAVGTGSVSCL